MKNKDEPVFTAPPPPPDLDFSLNTSELDSSDHEPSFSSDLPLSDLNSFTTKHEKPKTKDNKKSVDADIVAKDTLEEIEEGKEEEESRWDSSGSEDGENQEIAKVGGAAITKYKESLQKPQEKEPTIKLSMTPEEDESDWDSETEESEQRLNPRSPEPVSEFEPSSDTASENEELDLDFVDNNNKVSTDNTSFTS